MKRARLSHSGRHSHDKDDEIIILFTSPCLSASTFPELFRKYQYVEGLPLPFYTPMFLYSDNYYLLTYLLTYLYMSVIF